MGTEDNGGNGENLSVFSVSFCFLSVFIRVHPWLKNLLSLKRCHEIALQRSKDAEGTGAIGVGIYAHQTVAAERSGKHLENLASLRPCAFALKYLLHRSGG